MNYLVTSTSLILFALLYELSGGEDFVASSDRAEKVLRGQDQLGEFKISQQYVPFDEPVITPTRTPEPAKPRPSDLPAGFDIVQASMVDDVVASAAPEVHQDIRIVAGDWVNMRAGPATSFEVLTTLPQGVEAEVLQVTDTDWAEIRLLETQETGWMAAWLLSD